MTGLFQSGKFLGVIFLFAGFLVSIEVFREFRIPFTSIVLGRLRHESPAAEQLAAANESAPSRRRGKPPADIPPPRLGGRPGDGPSAYHGRMSPPPAARTVVSRPVASSPTVSPAAGMAIVVGSAALFGTLGPLSRFAYDAGMEPPAFVVWRALIGLAATAAFVAWRVRRGDITLARWPALPGSARRLLLLAALMGFTLNLAMFIAFDRITVALALLGFYTYPAMVAVANAVLGRDRLDRRADRRPGARAGRDGRRRRLAARPSGRHPASTPSASAWRSAPR